jgi:F5/8 type C domain
MKRTLILAAAVFLLGGCFESGPKITVSTVSNNLNGDSLLESKAPGWHAATPPSYPEYIQVDLGKSDVIGYVGLLPQEGQFIRFAKAIRVDISDDGKTWKPIAGSDNMCEANMPDGWTNLSFSPEKARYIKIMIFSNCGDANLLTVQGLRFGK